jgi:ligand-binding SRPBCC domain-containing protein
LADTREEPIAGITSGLIDLDQSVTWRARHLGKNRILKTKIVKLQRPHLFTDEQVVGDFSHMEHEHHFRAVDNGTIMIDIFNFSAPFGRIGMIFNQLVLKKYISRLLEKRNKVIKEYSESEKWVFILHY